MGKTGRKKRKSKLGFASMLRQPYWTLSRVEQLVEMAVRSNKDSVWVLTETTQDLQDLKAVQGRQFALPIHCGCEESNEYFVVEP